jgi:glycine/D-amino acid oxidase-like deaminating enzyme
LLQRANGFTIAGSNEERAGFDTTVNEGTCREIHAHATQLWPELKDHVAVERWMGFRPACEDMLPRIGRFEDTNVWLAYGHYRNGILLAPVTAQKIAGEITSSLGTG